MSGSDQDKQELRLPWGNLDGNNPAHSMQNDMEAFNLTAFFESIEHQETQFTFPLFQKHWNALADIQCTPEQLSIIISKATAAIKRLQETDPELAKNYLSEIMFRLELWEDQATAAIPKMDPFDIAQCLWAYKELDVNPRDDFIDKWYEYGNVEKILQGGPEEHRIVRALISSAHIRWKPSDSLWSKWNPKALAHADNFSHIQTSFFLWPYARFGSEPIAELKEKWMNRLDHLLATEPETFRPTDLANILGAAAALHAITGKENYKEVAQKVNPLIDGSKCNIPQLRQIGLARLWFDWENDAPMPDSDQRSSKREIRLRGIFTASGFNPKQDDATLDDLHHKPDIHLEHQGQDIILEVDGPTHFLEVMNEITGQRDPAGFTGRTLFMSALINKLAANAILIRLPYPAVDRILQEDPLQQKQILTSLLDQAANAEQGRGYHMRLSAPSTNDNKKIPEPEIRPLKIHYDDQAPS